MKTFLIGLFISFFISPVVLLACPYCQSAVKRNVYNQDFGANLFVLLLPLFLLLMIGIGLYYSDALLSKQSTKRSESSLPI